MTSSNMQLRRYAKRGQGSIQTAGGDAVPVDDDRVSAAVLLFDDDVVTHVKPRLIDGHVTAIVTHRDDALRLWLVV